MKRYLQLGALCALAATAPAGGAEPAAQKMESRIEAFAVDQVRLLDGPFKEAMETNGRHLLAFDPDRLLRNFRLTAGLPAPGEPYTGWAAPDCDVRGHFPGHYLSALALMFAATGDEVYKQRSQLMVGELVKVQEALGAGYLSAFPESHWDIVEAAKPNWAQYYTIHKILAGLIDQYLLCDDARALEAAKGMASYFKKRLDKLSSHQMDRVLGATEEGGISEALWNLYAITGDADHAALAEKFEKVPFLGPLALEHDNLSGLHGNTHIPLAIGAARHHELTGDSRYATVARFFWDRVVRTRSYATGGSTMDELWPEPNQLAGTLGFRNHETCKTHNMLKLTRHLLQWTGDAAYADFYERAFLNGILGTQEPEEGRLMYYVPLERGSRRWFSSQSDHFFCCDGTGIESFAKLNDSIYFHDAQGLYVSLFIPSKVEWGEKGATLEQRTRFPEEDITTLTWGLASPTSLALHVRVPYWVSSDVHVEINGEPQPIQASPGSFLKIEREWHDGDTVSVQIPMALHTQPMPDDPEFVAIMYGPLVLAGLTDPDHTPEETGILEAGENFPPSNAKPNHAFFLGDKEDLSAWLQPVAGEPLTFRTVGQEQDVTFVPFNRILRERYGIYWIVTEKDGPGHQRMLEEIENREKQVVFDAEFKVALDARTVDRVEPGDAALEVAHNLLGEETRSGDWQGKHWRDAGKWWSWDLGVEPDTTMTLRCTYWGSDGGRVFDISVDGKVLARQTLDHAKPSDYLHLEYAIPSEMTAGKAKVTVEFRAVGESLAGGVFECRILRPAPLAP